MNAILIFEDSCSASWASLHVYCLLTKDVLSIGCAFSPNTTRQRRGPTCPGSISSKPRNNSTEASPENAFKERVEKIKETHREPYPRLESDSRRMSCSEFRSRYDHLGNNETADDTVVLCGRINSSRASGSKLRFFDFVQEGHKVQILCNQRRMDGVPPDEFKKAHHIFRRGDAFCMYTLL